MPVAARQEEEFVPPVPKQLQHNRDRQGQHGAEVHGLAQMVRITGMNAPMPRGYRVPPLIRRPHA